MNDDDVDPMLRVFTDPPVMKAFALESYSRSEMVRWVTENLEHQKEHGYGLFALILKKTDGFIGNCGLEHTTFEGAPCVELGYDLHSDYWNQGYATEAATAVRDFAIDELAIPKEDLCSFIRQTKKASMRVSEKIGMVRVKPYTNHGIDYFLYRLA